MVYTLRKHNRKTSKSSALNLYSYKLKNNAGKHSMFYYLHALGKKLLESSLQVCEHVIIKLFNMIVCLSTCILP